MTLPLSRIRVLDVSQIMAGPFCCMLLGDMGGWARSGKFAIESDSVNAYFDRLLQRPVSRLGATGATPISRSAAEIDPTVSIPCWRGSRGGAADAQ